MLGRPFGDVMEHALRHVQPYVHLAADISTTAATGAYLSASLLGLIRGVENVIAGALVIVLLVLRIRAHLKK